MNLQSNNPVLFLIDRSETKKIKIYLSFSFKYFHKDEFRFSKLMEIRNKPNLLLMIDNTQENLQIYKTSLMAIIENFLVNL